MAVQAGFLSDPDDTLTSDIYCRRLVANNCNPRTHLFFFTHTTSLMVVQTTRHVRSYVVIDENKSFRSPTTSSFAFNSFPTILTIAY